MLQVFVHLFLMYLLHRLQVHHITCSCYIIKHEEIIVCICIGQYVNMNMLEKFVHLMILQRVLISENVTGRNLENRIKEQNILLFDNVYIIN